MGSHRGPSCDFDHREGRRNARLVTNAYCGVVIEPGVSSELASSIMLLRNDRTICEVMGKNGRALIDEHFSARRALATWNELFENL